MSRTLPWSSRLALLACAVLLGCATNASYLAANMTAAQTACESRAKFELDCQDVTGSVLSKKVIQGPLGFERAEYTVGVRGCGKRVVYLAVCRDSENCNALADTGKIIGSGD